MALLKVRMSMLISGEEQKLTTEECSAMPVEVRPLMIYLHLKSLQANQEYSRLVDVSETTLALLLRKDTYIIFEIYIFLLCALGHIGLNETDEARRYIIRAMEFAFPSGFIMPFVEFLAPCEGLVEQCLDQQYPEMKEIVLNKWTEVWENWITFRNAFLNGDGMTILSLREYQIALTIAGGLTYEETAGRFGLSLGRIRNITSAIYGKLNVTSRSELKDLMMHGRSSKIGRIESYIKSAFKE